jgi:hypothetical protein
MFARATGGCVKSGERRPKLVLSRLQRLQCNFTYTPSAVT